MYGLAIDPQRPATLYASAGGVFKSTDEGRRWRRLGSMRNVSALAIDPQTPTTLYARAGGVFKSTDGGRRWRRSGSMVHVKALAIDPAEAGDRVRGCRH